MEKLKKLFVALSIIALVICVGILISAIFGVNVFEKEVFYVLLTLATVIVASTLSINALNMIPKNKVVGILSLFLLWAASVLAIIIFWSNFNTPVLFNKITIVIGMVTILFNIMCSLSLKLGKKLRGLQTITFLLIIAIDIVTTLLIFDIDVFTVAYASEAFLVACILTFGLLCTLGILGRKNRNEVVKLVEVKSEQPVNPIPTPIQIINQSDNDSNGKVSIPLKEYNDMLNKIYTLETELNKYKNAEKKD